MAHAPIDLGRHPVFDEVRQTTTLVVRLGVKRKKGDDEYPEEVDYFVLKPEDGATPEIIEAYGPRPKELRLMLLHPAPERDRPRPTDALVLQINNTAWSWNSGLLCKGTGADEHKPGRFVSTERAFAERVLMDTGAQVQENDDGTYGGPCFGLACRKYRHMVERKVEERGRAKRTLVLAPIPFGDGKRDADAPCKLTILFKAALLHPTDPDPGHILALVQIASGSINTIKDVLYGFDMIGDHTAQRPGQRGRTHKIPFWLMRKPTTTTKVARRQHWTLAIRPTPTEWKRYAEIPEEDLYLPPRMIAELMEQRESLRAYRDVIPRPLELAAHAGADLNEIERRVHASHVPQGDASPGVVTDRDEALRETAAGQQQAEPAEGPTFVPDPELDRVLSDTERAALKAAVGVEPTDPQDPQSPSKPETLKHLHRWVHEYDRQHGFKTGKLSALTVRHDRWIRAQLAPTPVTTEDDDDLPQRPADAATGGVDATTDRGPVQDGLWREAPGDENVPGLT